MRSLCGAIRTDTDGRSWPITDDREVRRPLRIRLAIRASRLESNGQRFGGVASEDNSFGVEFFNKFLEAV